MFPHDWVYFTMALLITKSAGQLKQTQRDRSKTTSEIEIDIWEFFKIKTIGLLHNFTLIFNIFFNSIMSLFVHFRFRVCHSAAAGGSTAVQPRR